MHEQARAQGQIGQQHGQTIELVPLLIGWINGTGVWVLSALSSSPPQGKFKPGRYHLLVLLYDRYIDNKEMYRDDCVREGN